VVLRGCGDNSNCFFQRLIHVGCAGHVDFKHARAAIARTLSWNGRTGTCWCLLTRDSHKCQSFHLFRWPQSRQNVLATCNGHVCATGEGVIAGFKSLHCLPH
jgi:hypothetical protein